MSGWDFACPDWADRLKDGKSIVPDLPLDDAEAARAVAIFNKLRLPDVPGQPELRDAAGEWQRDIVRALFGSVQDGVRHVPELLLMVPKKSSKTTMGAALTITALLMNQRPRAEMIYVGPTQEVADLAFQQTVGMIEADKYLTKRFHIAHHTKTITDRRNKARLKVKTFDMKVVTGSKPAWVLLDELHLMATISGASRIIGQIRGGVLPNPEAALVMITTQSDEPPAGAFKVELEYARRVRDGAVSEGRLLPLLFEFPEAMQIDGSWQEPGNWHMVLPNLDRPVTLDQLVAAKKEAEEKGEEELRRWASQHLNVQIGTALAYGGWIGAHYWDSSVDVTLTFQGLLDQCDVVVTAIDGGGLDDLLGFAALGRHKATRDWLLWVHAWAQAEVLERRPEIADKLRGFVADGDLTICDEPLQDVMDLCDLVDRVRDAGLLPETDGVGVDPMLISAIVDELAARGYGPDMIVGVPQGYRLAGAIWGAERKLKDGTLLHADQPMAAWCVGNAKIEPRGNAVLITKQVAGKAKIDPLIAALNAVTLMSRNPVAHRVAKPQLLFI